MNKSGAFHSPTCFKRRIPWQFRRSFAKFCFPFDTLPQLIAQDCYCYFWLCQYKADCFLFQAESPASGTLRLVVTRSPETETPLGIGPPLSLGRGAGGEGLTRKLKNNSSHFRRIAGRARYSFHPILNYKTPLWSTLHLSCPQ